MEKGTERMIQMSLRLKYLLHFCNFHVYPMWKSPENHIQFLFFSFTFQFSNKKEQLLTHTKSPTNRESQNYQQLTKVLVADNTECHLYKFLPKYTD